MLLSLPVTLHFFVQRRVLLNVRFSVILFVSAFEDLRPNSKRFCLFVLSIIEWSQLFDILIYKKKSHSLHHMDCDVIMNDCL